MVISDIDDAGHAYRNSLEFAEYTDLDASTTQIVLSIEDAIPFVTERLSG